MHPDYMDLRVNGHPGSDHHGPSMSCGMAIAFASTTEACNFDHLDLGSDVSSNRGYGLRNIDWRLTAEISVTLASILRLVYLVRRFYYNAADDRFTEWQVNLIR